ncbi:MAG: hypothetical protein QGI88_13955, partial [SAR202 cluster bacterium]|nr:hypothetical protein [SAR202 cluster bacterium]
CPQDGQCIRQQRRLKCRHSEAAAEESWAAQGDIFRIRPDPSLRLRMAKKGAVTWKSRRIGIPAMSGLVEGPPTLKRRISRYGHLPNTLYSTFLAMMGAPEKEKRLGLLRQNGVFSDQILRPSALGRI